MGAVELVITEDNFGIPEWQKEKVREARKFSGKKNSSTLME